MTFFSSSLLLRVLPETIELRSLALPLRLPYTQAARAVPHSRPRPGEGKRPVNPTPTIRRQGVAALRGLSDLSVGVRRIFASAVIRF